MTRSIYFFKAFDRHEGFYIDCHLDGIQKNLENTPLGMSLRDYLESVDVGRPTLTVDVPFHGWVSDWVKRNKLTTSIPCSLLLFCGFHVTSSCLLLQEPYPPCCDRPCPLEPWAGTKPSSLKPCVLVFCCSNETSGDSGILVGVARLLRASLSVCIS